ncbi:MAG: glycine oxidase ThiO [Sedimenticolaceae bacterium]
MKQIVIVGGGVAGMLSALELAQAGQSVLLFDRADTGRESSWAGGGIISPLFPWRYLDSVTHLASWGQSHYAHLATTLAQHTGVDPEYTECGLILVAPDETEAARKWAEQHHRQMEVIDAEEFYRLEPQAAEPTDALWMPAVGQVRNPRLARALRRRLEQLGVEIRTDSEVRAILQTNGRCHGVDSSAGRFSADVVVVCAGAWSARLLADLPVPPAIAPMRGQMLMFKAEPGTISRMVLESNRYVIPRRDGRTLFGSTIEDVGFDKQTTQEARDELYRIATERFPILEQYPIEAHWAGLRPSSPAGVPYIGRHPQIDGLFINAGHFRNGIVLGPASARLLADLVLERKPIVDPAPYAWTAARG